MVLAMIIAGLIALAICLTFLIQGAPYVKSNDQDAEAILKLAKKYRPKRILDLGSGNGKLVILLAQNGFKTDGIEINPLLVFQSKRAIKKAGLQGRANITLGSFWRTDVSEYDLVTLYAIQHIMPKLEKKFHAELKPGTYVISNYFTFPNAKPELTRGRLCIYKF